MEGALGRVPIVRRGGVLAQNLFRPASVVFWIAAACLMPTFIGDSTYRLGQLNYILALLMVATGLNITLGFAGILFLGPSALFAVAGYTAAVGAFHSSALQSLPMMCLAGVIMALAVSVVLALPSLRISGFYLGMVTLFLASVIPQLTGVWNLTGGSNGLSLETLPNFYQHPSGRALYLVGVAMLSVLCGYAWLIKNSRLGRRFGILMSSDHLAESIGVSPYRTKLVAFLLGAVPCAIGGAFYVYSEQFISSSAVEPTLSIYILAGLTIGGSGTIIGPLLGTALVGAFTEFLGHFNQYQGIAYGVALIAVAVGAPSGFVGLYTQFTTWLRSTLSAPSPARQASQGAGVTASIDQETRRSIADRLSVNESPPLVVKGARRQFGGVTALADVDLQLEPGVVHALVGPNGSGKTTLLNLVSGFYRIGGGEIWLGDQRLDQLKAANIARLGIARTFQTPKLVIAGTALENVLGGVDFTAKGSLTSSVLHTPSALRAEKEGKAEALTLLQEIGLGGSADRQAGLMPHGTQRLLEIGRAMAIGPRYLLLDEPAAGLAGSELEALKVAVRDIANAGVGVLLVEHNLPVVFGLADVVTVLHQGQVIASGTPTQVSADPEVVRVYIGKERPTARPVTVQPQSPIAKALGKTLGGSL